VLHDAFLAPRLVMSGLTTEIAVWHGAFPTFISTPVATDRAKYPRWFSRWRGNCRQIGWSGGRKTGDALFNRLKMGDAINN